MIGRPRRRRHVRSSAGRPLRKHGTRVLPAFEWRWRALNPLFRDRNPASYLVNDIPYALLCAGPRDEVKYRMESLLAAVWFVQESTSASPSSEANPEVGAELICAVTRLGV